MKSKNLKFEVFCENKTSFQIALVAGQDERARPGRAVALVKCDRTDFVDNRLGLELASTIRDLLNTLPQDKIRRLVATEMLPPL